MFALSSCGVLSAPERDETPSALALRAQEAYDKKDFAKAVELLEKLKKLDPSNVDARIKLAFSYMAVSEIKFTETIKGFAELNGAGGGLTGLTSNSGLDEDQLTKLKSENNVSLLSADELRAKSAELNKFHKAFLSLCELFSAETIYSLKESAKSASEILQLEQCGAGLPESRASVSIAALFLAINQFSTFAKLLDFDKNNDGKIDIEETASSASTKISGATDINQLTTAMKTLTDTANFLSSDGFKWAFAQFKIIDAVIVGSGLPEQVKAPLTKITQTLKESIDKINGYVDQGASTGSSVEAGAKAKDAADNAKGKVDDYLKQPQNAQAKESSCQQFFCMRKSFNLGTALDDMPNECKPLYGQINNEENCNQ
jgi:tetratricopeptide (TPR) repeat protein